MEGAKVLPNSANRPPVFLFKFLIFDPTDIQVVLARSHARNVALEAAFHAPDGAAFGRPEERPKPRGATIGGATFGCGAKTPEHDEAKTPERRPRSEVPSAKAPGQQRDDQLLSCATAKGRQRRCKDEE